jgi:hypothetical protein
MMGRGQILCQTPHYIIQASQLRSLLIQIINILHVKNKRTPVEMATVRTFSLLSVAAALSYIELLQ